MKSFWKITATVLVAGGVIAGLVFAFTQGRKELAADAASEGPIAAPARAQSANGRTAIALDRNTQKLIGLETAALTAATLSPEIMAYGRVLDPQPLVGLVTDIATARVSLEASTKEHTRLKALFDQGQNASAKTLETAEAAMKHDQIALQAAESQLLAGWGSAIAEEPDLPAFVQSLASRNTALAQLTLPIGEWLAEAPKEARLLPAGASRPIAARLLGRAATTDRQVQGDGFLFVATNASGALTPGLALSGFLQLPGEPLRGVVVPDAAIVRWADSAWVYAQTDDTHFERREMAMDHPVKDGWLVTNGVAPSEHVVITGAQALLSEERKTEIKPAD
jgi:hypothetical protein